MNILAIFGSPRTDGLSSLIHDEFLKQFPIDNFIINRISVYSSIIDPCTDCGFCDTSSSCCISDSMDEIYGLLTDSDLISLSSPLYFSGLPGPVKNLIDRCEVFWKNSGMLSKNKKAMFISTAGNDGYKDMFTASTTVVRHFFKTLKCEFDPDQFILLPGTDSLKDLPHDTIKRARLAGLSLADKLIMGRSMP